MPDFIKTLLIGKFELCLKVRDFEKSVEFYKKLGFEDIIDWKTAGYSTLKNENCTISLYKDDIDKNLLNSISEAVTLRKLQNILA